MTSHRLGDGTDAVLAVADARPATPATQSCVEPGGHPTPGAALGEGAAPGTLTAPAVETTLHGTAGAGGPTCCRACREHRSQGVGHSRRWALTDKGHAAIGSTLPAAVDVPVLTRAGLQLLATQHQENR